MNSKVEPNAPSLGASRSELRALLPRGLDPAFVRQSMVVACQAASHIFAEKRDLLGRVRFINHRANDVDGREAPRLYLKLELPEDETSLPEIRWMFRPPKYSGVVIEPNEAELEEDEAFGYTESQLKIKARPFELEAVLAIEAELKKFRRYCWIIAESCGEAVLA